MKGVIKRLPAIVCAIITMMLLFGCGRQEQPTQAKPAIQLMHGWGGSGSLHEEMRSIYADFSLYAPEVNITFLALPVSGLVIEKANDMLAVNKMTDIVSTSGIAQFVSNTVAKNKALNLMPYIQADPELKNSIDPSVFDIWHQEDGTLYTVPDVLEVTGYWYNTKIFEKAGIDAPPTTWNELWSDCEKIKKWNQSTGEDVMPFALENELLIEYFLPAYIAGISQEGLQFVSNQPSSYNAPVFRAGLQAIRRAYGYSHDIVGLEDARQAFRDGKVAVYFNGLWECEQFKAGAAERDIAYANYPTMSGDTLSFVSPASGYVLCRSGDEKRQETSVQFLKYILSEEQQTRLLLETGQVPCNPNVSIETARKERPLLTSALQEARNAHIQIKSIGSAWDGEIIDKLKSSVEKFGKGGMTEDELIQTLDQR